MSVVEPRVSGVRRLRPMFGDEYRAMHGNDADVRHVDGQLRRVQRRQRERCDPGVPVVVEPRVSGVGRLQSMLRDQLGTLHGYQANVQHVDGHLRLLEQHGMSLFRTRMRPSHQHLRSLQRRFRIFRHSRVSDERRARLRRRRLRRMLFHERDGLRRNDARVRDGHPHVWLQREQQLPGGSSRVQSIIERVRPL